MPAEKFLDASDMEPPQPLEAAVQLLEQLRPGECLRMAHRMIPWLLFEYCRAHALEYRVQPGTTARYEILIWHAGDSEATAGRNRDDA